MRFNKLDLNQLVVLDALLDLGSVKRASERLFLSPPATSCALARLRSYFDDELMVQVGKKMVLTPKAQSLKKSVRDVLLQVQTITTSSPSFDPTTSDRLVTIETSDYVMLVFLGAVLRQAQIEAPLMRFDLRLSHPASAAALENGQTDLLIAPAFLCALDHPAEHLFDDDWSCLVCRDNPLVGDELTMEDYLSLGHLDGRWSSGPFVTSDASSAQQLGLVRRREVSVPPFTIGPHLLRGTHRVMTLQTRLANELAAGLPLRVLPCPMAVPPLVEMVQWNKHQESDLSIVWVLDLLRRVARALPPVGRAAAASPVDATAAVAT